MQDLLLSISNASTRIRKYNSRHSKISLIMILVLGKSSSLCVSKKQLLALKEKSNISIWQGSESNI